jgi:hypothetical protein
MIDIKVIPIFEHLPDNMKQDSFKAFTYIYRGRKRIQIYETASSGVKAKRKLIKLLSYGH